MNICILVFNGYSQGIELPNHRIDACLFLLIENIASFPVWFYHFTFPPTVDINFVILINVIYLCDFIYILLMTNCIEHIIICSLTFGYLFVWRVYSNLLPIFWGFFFLLMICSHSIYSLWDECNDAVVWAFFGIAFLWDWSEDWSFPVPWPLLSFPNFLAYWMQHFHSIIF